MYPQHALVAGAALAAGAHAFMISSNMLDPQSLEDKASSEFGLNIARLMNPETSSRLVKVECPGCAYPVAGKQDVFTMDQENDLIFNFQTTEDGKTLTLNGHPFFPVNLYNAPVNLYAPQAPSDVSFDDLRDSFHEVASTPRRLRFFLGTHETEAADGTEATLADIAFHVTAIDDQEITVDELNLRVLRDEKGILSIVDVVKKPQNGQLAHEAENEPSAGEQMFKIMPIGPDSVKPQHGHKSRPHTTCSGPAAVFCRWAELVEDKMSAAWHGSFGGRPTHGRPKRPCPGKMGKMGQMLRPKVPVKGGIPKFMIKHTPEEIRPDHVAHHPHPHHGARPHRHHDDSFFSHLDIAAKRVFFGFVVPVLVGVVAGMSTTILGMLVGCFIGYVWTKFVRGGRRGCQYEQAAQTEAADVEDIEADSEKKGLLSPKADDEEALPVYSEHAEQNAVGKDW